LATRLQRSSYVVGAFGRLLAVLPIFNQRKSYEKNLKNQKEAEKK